MSKFFQPATLTGAIAMVLTSTVTFANESNDQPSIQLNPIVVTASKIAENVSEVPARISVISKEVIEQNPALNLSDVLQKDASIAIKQYGGIGQSTELYLRGSNANYTLLLKDGTRFNTSNSLSPIYPEVLDLTDIKQIEILKGPASVQYGSDAIGGVVQMLSATPNKNSAFVTGLYGENNTYKAIAGVDIVLPQGFYAQLRGQRLESDGTSIFDTQNDDLKAGFDQKGYSAKLGYDDQNRLKAAIEISRNEGINQYSDNGGMSNTAQRQFENQLVNLNASALVLDHLTINARYSNFQDQQHFVESSPYYADTERNEGDVNAKWQFTSKQNILAGISFDNQEYKNASILDSKQSVDTIGYYLQHQYNSDKLNTQLGVRIEDNEKFDVHTVGQGAIRYHFTPATSIYANIGSAFRAPSLTELYYHNEADYGSWGIYHTYGNTELKPEESIAYEIGLDHQLNSALSLYLSAYKTDIENLITSSPSYNANTNTTTTTYENINQANFQGGEIGLKWVQNNLFLSTAYAYVKTENEQTKLEIAYRPRQTYTLTAGYEDGIYGVNTSLIARSEANAQNSANSIKIPGYATVDLNAFWNIHPNLKLFTNIQNVGDVRYETVYNFGNWYINGGRQTSVGVTFRY